MSKRACKHSPSGKLFPDELYTHRSALDHLEPLLRIYEGCGRSREGDRTPKFKSPVPFSLEGANIIKIHRRFGKLSYLI